MPGHLSWFRRLRSCIAHERSINCDDHLMGICQLVEGHELGESGRGGRRRADPECGQRLSPSAVVVRAAHRSCGPAPWGSAPARGQQRGSRSALRTLLLACAFARGADGSGVRACAGSGAMSPSAARGGAVLLSASLAALQPNVALGATPLFSTYFPSESCCKKPNFLNENIAPELTRCRQVGVSRVRGCVPPARTQSLPAPVCTPSTDN